MPSKHKKPAKSSQLADQIASLFQPAPAEFNPDEEDFDGTFAKVADYSSEEEADSTAPKAREQLPMRAPIEMEEEEYAGRVVSTVEIDSESGSSVAEFPAEESESDSDVPETLGTFDDVDDELDALEAEDASVLQVTASATSGQAEKAVHAKNQRMLWEDFVETRIRLQQMVHIANRLPQPDTRALFVEAGKGGEGGITIGAQYNATASSLTSMVQTLLDTQKALLQRNPDIITPNDDSSDSGDGEDDGDVEAVWRRLESQQAQLQPYVEQVVERWHSSTQSHSGATGKKFKVVNQGIMSQVEAVLSDQDRLLKRAHTRNSHDYRVLGESPLPASKPAEDIVDFSVFHDTEFYQQLLKELVDAGSSRGDTMAQEEASRLKVKRKRSKKRSVDTKASKGRRLRYEVHPKLQNFMAPQRVQGSVADPTSASAEIITSLFGRRPSVTPA